MTQRANPSVNRPVEAYKSAGAMALAGGTETGWISPSGTPSDISVQDRAILEEELNAFKEDSSNTSLSVIIDPGEAFVFGSWIVKDTTTSVSLAPDTSNQIVYVGWNNNLANDVIIGLESEFNTDPNDSDQKIPLYSYDTDSQGVTSVTDKRQIGKYLNPDEIDIAERLGLPSYQDSSSAPQESGNIIFVDGTGTELPGIYTHRNGNYERIRDTDDELQDLIRELLVASGGITITYDDTSGSITIDGATQYTDSLARDAVLSQVTGSNNITITSTTVNGNDGINVTVPNSSITETEIDEGISPTWTGNHTFTRAITQQVSPSAGSDVATKEYVDSTDQGLDIKESCLVAAESNINLSSSTDPNPIDDVTITDGSRVLLKEQSDATENGIYVASTSTDPTTWSRSSDADESSEVTNGFFTFIEQGLENSSIGFVLIGNNPSIGTDPINFSPFSDAGQTSAGDALTKTGDTISHIDTSSQSSVNSAAGSAITDIILDEQGHTTSINTTDLDKRYVESDSDEITGTLTITGSIDASNAKEIITSQYNSITDAQSVNLSDGVIVYISNQNALYQQRGNELIEIPAFDVIKDWVNNNSDVPIADVARGFESRTSYPNNPESGRVIFRPDKT